MSYVHTDSYSVGSFSTTLVRNPNLSGSINNSDLATGSGCDIIQQQNTYLQKSKKLYN